jgi:hypothetical protein
MMHKGARATGGNMPAELQQKVNNLLDEFGVLVQGISHERHLQRAIVRSLLPCSLVVVLDKNNLFILAQRHFGTPSSLFIHIPEKQLTPWQALDSARWEFGLEDPFLIAFPSALLEQEEVQRQPALEAVAVAHVASEFQRVKKMTSLIQINPLFGPASYSVDEQLAFVLMPFAEDLTAVYTSIIKPTVEEMGLVCRGADDFKTNKAIIQDIWKAICEARIVIADLTDLNPNVMYELGIAHTVGKETVLIYQRGRGKDPKFPFDLAHIRRIEYEDSATGGKKLENDLSETLKSVLKPVAVS